MEPGSQSNECTNAARLTKGPARNVASLAPFGLFTVLTANLPQNKFKRHRINSGRTLERVTVGKDQVDDQADEKAVR
jgi:hypothetical protein